MFFATYESYSRNFSNYYFREKLILFALSLIIIISGLSLAIRGFFYITREIPLNGGIYIEGITGQPKTINPLFASSNLPDRALGSLIYSGLTKFDEKGNIVPDIAKSWELKNEKNQYVFKLRKDIKWHDGEQLLSNDVLYTISVIQDPDYTGPLKNQWRDIKIEIPDEFTVVFTLEKPQSSFIYNTTLGILPEHIWAGFEVSDLPYVEENLRPVGSGIFRFKEVKTDESNFIRSITLERNEEFYNLKPMLETVVFKFYKTQEETFEALTKKEIMGMTEITPDMYSKIKKWERLRISSNTLPSYKAIFINASKNPLLASIDFRTALDLSIDKEKLVNEKLVGTAIFTDGIFVKDKAVNNFDLEKAREFIKKTGLKDENNDGFLEKDGKKVELKLSILEDKESETVAQAIKNGWLKLGIDLKVEKKPSQELERDIIRPRNYELLFFGQSFGLDADLFPFWHSSQQKDSGLNFTNFASKRTDVLLENARNLEDINKKKEVNEKIEELVKAEKAAIFLASPIYNFVADKKVKGIKRHFLIYPEHRFIGIEKWYTKSKRVF